MPHFSTNDQARKWFKSKPGKSDTIGVIQVDTLGLWGELSMTPDGSVTFRRGIRGESLVSRPDGSVQLESVESTGAYSYYYRRWVQSALWHLLGIKCVQRYGRLWIPCQTSYYEGVGYVPLIQGNPLTFVMPDGDNYRPTCTNPVFITVRQIDRAGKAEALEPYKPFLKYAKGVLKLRGDEPLTYEDVSAQLPGNMPGPARYDMLRQEGAFRKACATMLSEDPMKRHRMVYRLILAGSQSLNGSRWGDDTEANPQRCLDHAVKVMFATHMPDKVLKQVTPTTGKIISSQYT
jgi:hypothetical protein